MGLAPETLPDGPAPYAPLQSAEPRFGLPLSLLEALEQDRSDLARQLAALLRHDGGSSPAGCLGLTLAMALTILFGSLDRSGVAQAQAASLRGVWTLAPEASWFDAPILGSPPDAATLVVARDDVHGLSYSLVETLQTVEVARAEYQASWPEGRVTARVNGAAVTMATASRDADGGATLTTGPVRGWQAAISIHATGPDRVQVDHFVWSEGKSYQLEQLTFRRGASPIIPPGGSAPTSAPTL